MVQVGRGLRFVLETLKLLGIEHCRKRQDLECHAPAQRDLHGLVDNPHPAPADLADNAIVAQPAGEIILFLRAIGRLIGGRQTQHLQRGEHLTDDGCDLGMPIGILLDVRLLAAVEPIQKLVGDLGKKQFRTSARRARLVAHSADSVSPMSRSDLCSRTNARPCRLRATSGAMSRMYPASE